MIRKQKSYVSQAEDLPRYEFGYIAPAPAGASAAPLAPGPVANWVLTEQAAAAAAVEQGTVVLSAETVAAATAAEAAGASAVATAISTAAMETLGMLMIITMSSDVAQAPLIRGVVEASTASFLGVKAAAAPAPAPAARRYGDEQTCLDTKLDALGDIKDAACNRKRRCADQRFTCDDILRIIEMNEECKKAREDVRDECFGGNFTDLEHAKKYNEVLTTLEECFKRKAKLCK